MGGWPFLDLGRDERADDDDEHEALQYVQLTHHIHTYIEREG
jgi:hypothetical protein